MLKYEKGKRVIIAHRVYNKSVASRQQTCCKLLVNKNPKACCKLFQQVVTSLQMTNYNKPDFIKVVAK